MMSCYLTPSDNIDEFTRKLESIEDKALTLEGCLIIAGDFNSKAVEWGSATTNSRGRRVLDMAARLGLVVLNTGASTYRKPGCEDTTPDITLASESIATFIKDWRVLEDYNGSDHQYITFRIEMGNQRVRENINKSTRKWNINKLNPATLLATIDVNQTTICTNSTAKLLVKTTMRCITIGCNASMPKIARNKKRNAVYWWTPEISELRVRCIHKRRKYTRARRLGPAITESEEYKQSRKELRQAISQSKKDKWEELRNDLNSNPWGLGYKIVMKKLGAKSITADMETEVITKIVDTLFPTHCVEREELEYEATEPVPFTEVELIDAAKAMKRNKAPGPDGIAAEILTVLAIERPFLLLNMYNACLKEGIFPELWKKQKLVLISKGKGDPTLASAYRPLCMLDSAGKLFEKLIKRRLSEAVENSGGLSERQHGFRTGRSTLGAIQDVISSVEHAQADRISSKSLVLLATLDIRNAFNSLSWGDVIQALKTNFKIPKYILKIIRSYLSNRVLLYETREGCRAKQITAGAAQGSILGPELWNISYDEILRIEMPEDVHLVGYADDIAAVITARNTDEAKRKLNQVMIRVQIWLEDHGLKLATEKTELILLTKRHIPLEVDMHVLGAILSTKRVVKYLGVQLDSRLTYWAHMNHAATKAAKVCGMLSKLMANLGGPTQSKRKLLMDTTNSILLYGCEIWADSLSVRCRRKLLQSVQRTCALRVASSYRTVSEAAVLVISGTAPIDLLAQERKQRWEAKVSETPGPCFSDIRTQTLTLWQTRWNSEQYGRWTARLIPDLKKWVERKHGEVNYYLTQFLSGHGSFCKYLWRMGKVNLPNCIYGDTEYDDAEHTFFKCERWNTERTALQRIIGACTPEEIIEKMMIGEEKWNAVANFVEDIIRKKRREMETYAEEH